MSSLCLIGPFNSDSAQVIHMCTASDQQFLEQNSYYGEVAHEVIKLIYDDLIWLSVETASVSASRTWLIQQPLKQTTENCQLTAGKLRNNTQGKGMQWFT